jgi:hypothetical protein
MSDAKTLDKMTVAELKQVADRIDVPYNSKTKKDDLFKAVSQKLADILVEQAKQKAAAQLSKTVKVTTPKPNSERVQTYVRQNGTKKLTVAQWRNVRRKMREGDNLTVVPAHTDDHTSNFPGMSFLAITPDGQHIFHRFSDVSA